MAKLLTLRWPSYWPRNGQKCGQVIDPAAYIYIYMRRHIYICCRVENLSKNCPCLSGKSVQGWVENQSKILLLLVFPQFYSVLGESCVGVRKYFFCGLSRCLLKRVVSKKCAFFAFVFLMLDKAKEKRWNKWKRTISRKAQKNSFGGWLWRRRSFFVKWHFLRKIGKHCLCSEGKKSAHFRCNYLFLEYGPFFVPIQSHQTLQK